MTATLTERSEGTAAHKGFNPKRKLENRDRGRCYPREVERDDHGGAGPSETTRSPSLILSRRRAGSFGKISLYAVRPLSQSVKIGSVVGARPQFIKAAPVSREIRQHHEEILIHTGQHYDENMSDVFFETLDIPRPNYNLGVGSASHARQTADMMRGLDEVLEKENPNFLLVYGDTNSTLAGALVAAKMGIPLGHVEAGLRSFNRQMPEEVNRVVADHLSNLLFSPTETAVENLTREGITRGVHMVGDVMYDVALQSAQAARSRDILSRLGLTRGEYLLVTLHRPQNVDDKGALSAIVEALVHAGRPVVFPVHPRTRKNLVAFDLWDRLRAKVQAIEPVDYLDFIALLMGSSKVVTDSGGVQKEAYFFGVPCVTLRDQTEWIETLEDGWNALVGTEADEILDAI